MAGEAEREAADSKMPGLILSEACLTPSQPDVSCLWTMSAKAVSASVSLQPCDLRAGGWLTAMGWARCLGDLWPLKPHVSIRVNQHWLSVAPWSPTQHTVV